MFKRLFLPLFILLNGIITNAQANEAAALTLYPEVKHGVSLPLRDLPHNRHKMGIKKNRPLLRQHIPLVSSLPQIDKSLLTNSLQTTLSVVTGLNFSGIDAASGSGTPPDTIGAIGTTQYVQMVNSAYAVYSKSTGALLAGPTDINDLFTGFGGLCESTNRGDPVVMFDSAASRWVLTQFAFDENSEGDNLPPFYQCVAVSTSADATSTYNLYSFNFGNDFNDYGKLGVWPDAYYMSFNFFNLTPVQNLGTRLCALDRENMLAGNAARPMQCFTPSNNKLTALPANLQGTQSPPSGAPGYFLGINNNNSLRLWRFHVDWNNSARSSLSHPQFLNVAPFLPTCHTEADRGCLPQKNTSQILESISDRLMQPLIYRNFGSYASLAVTHSVWARRNNGTLSSAIRWYELRIPNGLQAAKLNRTVTFSPDVNHRWIGSVAMDKMGNLAAGYSITNTNLFPGIRYALFDLSQSQVSYIEKIAVIGTGSQDDEDRWGDYSGMSIDPSDNCTFWYTNEYVPTTGNAPNWSTHITSFRASNCA